MDKLLELLRESVIVQGVLAVGTVGTTLYLMANGQEVPKELLALTSLVLGVYFGAKTENIKMRKMSK